MPLPTLARPPLPATLPRLHRLLDVCLALSAETDLDRLLTVILETATEVLDCRAASILLFDEASGRLRFAAATGADPVALAAIPVPLHGSLAGVIFRENRPLHVDDPAGDPRHFGEVGKTVAMRTEALIGVPLQVHGQPTGVLEALNPCNGRFAPDAIDVLTVIAAQAAVAVRNTAIDAAYGGEGAIHPVSRDTLRLAGRPGHFDLEASIRAAPSDRAAYRRKTWLLNLLGRILIRFGLHTQETDWARYPGLMRASADFRKFDDTLRMVLSGSAAQRETLTAWLDARRAEGRLAYGLHVSDRATLTCLVFNRMGRQVHFVDGADGGYTTAARQLKRQLAEGYRPQRRRRPHSRWPTPTGS